MDLWNETLDKINSMEIIKNNGKVFILVNNKYLVREFHYEKPYEFFNIQSAQEYINDIQEAIDAVKIARKNKKKLESQNND